MFRFRLFIALMILCPIETWGESVPVTNSSGASRCFEEFCFPTETQVEGDAVPILGIADYRYYFFRLYVAALYATRNGVGETDVLGDYPRKIVIHYHRRIEGRDVIRASIEALQSNPGVNVMNLESRLKLINQYYADGLNPGDVYELQYHPKSGTTLLVNGQTACTVEGDDFASAYFGIWLSEYALSSEFRDKLIRPVTSVELR